MNNMKTRISVHEKNGSNSKEEGSTHYIVNVSLTKLVHPTKNLKSVFKIYREFKRSRKDHQH